MELSKKELSLIINIFTARYKSVFNKNMSLAARSELTKELIKALKEYRLVARFLNSSAFLYARLGP